MNDEPPLLILPAAILRAVAAVLTEAYPAEGCGWLLEQDDQWHVRPVRNQLSADVARHRFVMADRDLIATVREADRIGARLAVMFHSHPDGPASVSAHDLRAWAPLGVPLYPKAAILIGAVRASGVNAWQGYRWSGSNLIAVPIETVTGPRRDNAGRGR